MLIKELTTISFMRNFCYLCCMINITIQPNTPMAQIRGMYGWNIAHGAMLNQVVQQCADVTGVKCVECSVLCI
jgi:hypothetical protein